MDIFCCIVIWTLFKLWRCCDANDFGDQDRICYLREVLLQFNCMSSAFMVDLVPPFTALPDFYLETTPWKTAENKGREKEAGKTRWR